MKTGTLLLGFIFALMSMNSAYARGYHGHHRGHGHHKGHYHDSGHHHYKRHYKRHRDVHHYDHGHHDTYREVHHYQNDNHSGNQVAYLIGGLIVGGIVGATLNQVNQNAIHNSNYRQPAYNPYR